ncbi:Uu.00g081390.m01.CDS01 [Anthostomella pinea]|uniref:lytic cellulose monooxygenase (C4-dehydrogenating) n=1 Tax=Anthostomella pinea TaxID=933095 RepID=A0AAI8VFS9_9PEZI|nr:Uu.00g081390.m01.CDS01 [Anthostomella pinea]
MKSITALALLVSAAQAAPHYTFPHLDGTADWSSVRQTANFQSNGPVTDVSSEAIRCYENAGVTGAPDTTTVAAGGSVTFVAAPSIYHPGALSAYMAKVPSGSTAATWDGSGSVWFKVFQDMPSVADGQYTWPSNGKSELAFTVPSCLAEGDYLFRIEHVALHSASSAGGAQFYISCAQLHVTGGSGSKTPSGLVAFPGAYSATDPGILINIYNNGGKAYQPAGPAVFSC